MSTHIDPHLAPEEVARLLRTYEGDYDYPGGLLRRAAEIIERQVRKVERPLGGTQDQRVRVQRVIFMEGPRWWVESTLERSWVQPGRPVTGLMSGAAVIELPYEIQEIR